jgi:hypothetical protein
MEWKPKSERTITHQIFNSDYCFVRQIGRGQFGTVCSYLHRPTKNHRAVKAIKCERDGTVYDTRQEI